MNINYRSIQRYARSRDKTIDADNMYVSVLYVSVHVKCLGVICTYKVFICMCVLICMCTYIGICTCAPEL